MKAEMLEVDGEDINDVSEKEEIKIIYGKS